MTIPSTPNDKARPASGEGADYYVEDGLLVFTEVYHLKRGYCCGSLCRHCPYDEKLVRCVSTASARERTA